MCWEFAIKAPVRAIYRKQTSLARVLAVPSNTMLELRLNFLKSHTEPFSSAIYWRVRNPLRKVHGSKASSLF